MSFTLGINTGFAVNRFTEADQWVPIIGSELGLKSIQLTADMLNPELPTSVINRTIKDINQLCFAHNTQVTSTFTGAFTRVNHLAHPDQEVRNYWINWFKKFIDMTVDLGAESLGSHPGIFTQRDNCNPILRAERRKQNIEGWHVLGEYAKLRGLKYLSWEPMSISREQGETLEEARKLQHDLNYDSPIDFKICLDVDHGDLSSLNPEDTNPYAWLKKFAVDSPLIHLKQSKTNKGGHWPFTREHNESGKIIPEKVIKTLIENGSTEACLLLELSFREREPTDSTVVEVLKESVAYWRKSVFE